MSSETHNIPPVYDKDSRILILGSFPSVLSRENEFFYAHPQNRFWKVTAAVLGCDIPTTTEQKKEFLLAHDIALWDVISRCEVTGSSDSSIKDVIPNDITPILKTAAIRRIYLNGKTAEKYYNRYLLPLTGISAVTLPSTSPANAKSSVGALTEAWKVILDDLA